MPVGTGSSSRGRGGKFKKYTRGGGKHFSRDIRPTDADGNEVSIWSVEKHEEDDDSDDDTTEESEEESSEEEGDNAGSSQAAAAQAASREDRKAQKKARKEAAIARQQGKTVEVGDLPSSDEDSDEDDDMPSNPNHSKAARKQATGYGVDEITEGVAEMAPPSRREREAIEAAAAKERYMRLQAQGKTEESQADLARLKIIREQRAAEAARRQAEKETKEETERKKRAEFEAREARKKEMKKKKK
ncbi:casein kinase substrate phosphoprotein PP28-domain-containing protein [Mariannaea sp. PMI_226]|nr:casein kinase substrate phosphoprotein PP28-domain-containing protein [Mariannaea sp. PMI_226]